tara:strand:+ start:970 stop:1962 length:993 start_codon:yes stop_codon:yes gene_type:complete
MKKFKTHLVIILLAFAFVGCFKDHHGDPNMDDEPFSDLNDVTTTALETTIPRVEISQSGTDINLSLSVTDQDGIPLENFTIGNYLVEMFVGSNSQIIPNASITLTEMTEMPSSDPLAVAATMDYSGSMSSQNRSDMESALKTFVNIKDANDEVAIIKFASSVQLVQDFTSDSSLLIDAIDRFPAVSGATAFYSSCDLGLMEADDETDVFPVVIGFTDGNDNNSSINLPSLITKAQDLAIPIYTVGFGSVSQTNLQTLADETGGRYFYAPNGEEIEDLYEIINGQLKKLYLFNWQIMDLPTGTEVNIRITTTYTGGNGTFTAESIKSVTIE